MKIAIHQPQYMPWLGYFDKMDQADVFVLLDDVQYKKNEWQNRNRIRTAEGWQWLTVPAIFVFGQKINEVKIDDHGKWREKHLKSLETNYSKAPFFEQHYPFFKEALSGEWDMLSDLNMHIIRYIKEKLGIKTELIISSDMDIKTTSTQRLIDICNELKADEYLAGAGGEDYMDTELFDGSGIKLEFQGFDHPVYDQMYEGFQPFMATIDLLFCHGGKSLDIIKSGRRP